MGLVASPKHDLSGSLLDNGESQTRWGRRLARDLGEGDHRHAQDHEHQGDDTVLLDPGQFPPPSSVLGLPVSLGPRGPTE